MASNFSLTKDARQVAFVLASPTALPEVHVSDVAAFAPRRLTAMSDQLTDLIVGRPEVISWTSQDGTLIEGVLIKPADFDASRNIPCCCRFTGVRPESIGPRCSGRAYTPPTSGSAAGRSS